MPKSLLLDFEVYHVFLKMLGSTVFNSLTSSEGADQDGVRGTLRMFEGKKAHEDMFFIQNSL